MGTVERDEREEALRRVVVGVTGTPGNLAALHRAAAEARVRGAELLAVLAWQSPGGELGSRHSLGPSALAHCRAAAVERLRETLDTAFGAVKPGVALEGLTVRGTPGAALVDVARDTEDLLVVGTGSRTLVRRLVRPSVARYCLAHASCPVLAVPPSPLKAELEAVHRRNAWRVPLDLRELTP
ncbi:universal stress protein [Streptomyces sp. WAC06614]|uniref:universal stress protein n=1 Tax=Streptomyces sp. WAC06614 TaxID=2487416 RepID=UPI000F79DADA|nr:universal stress protein [Streptomyces sp. WAC06614]RSS81739.1 universal stress protein [Streptomyces sp. WAC06614]